MKLYIVKDYDKKSKKSYDRTQRLNIAKEIYRQSGFAWIANNKYNHSQITN